MPNRGTMRAKQRLAGSLGQGSRFYYLAGKSFAKVAGSQGFGKTNPSIGSMKSLGVMKQNRNAGGNNVCKESVIPEYYYTQKIQLTTSLSTPLQVGSLIYIANTRIPLGEVFRDPDPEAGVGLKHADPRNLLPVGPFPSPLRVNIVPPGPFSGRPGVAGTITFANPPVRHVNLVKSNCNCNGPRGYCSNCSGRENPLFAITGGSTYSSTTGFTLLSH